MTSADPTSSGPISPSSGDALRRLRLFLARSPLMRVFAGARFGDEAVDGASGVPDEPWFPSATPVPGFAEAFYLGRAPLGGHRLELDHPVFEREIDAPEQWTAVLHGFGWLRPLRDEGTALAQSNAQVLAGDWIARFGGDLAHAAWDPDTAARRLDAWITHRQFLMDGANPALRKALTRAVAQHVRILRAMAGGTDGLTQARIGIALSLAHEALAGRTRGLGVLEQALPKVMADGAPLSREPRDAVEILCGLSRIRSAKRAEDAQASEPPFLARAADELAGWLAFLLHRDGTLAQFRGTGWLPRRALADLVPSGRPSPRAKSVAGGLARLEGPGGAVVIVDADGTAGQAGWASGGAFEMSVPSGRIVVSCGVPEREGALRDALKGAAAHSTFCADDPDGEASLPLPEAAAVQADDASLRLAARHGALLHRRELAFLPEGLAGTDEVEGEGKGVLRFHLHDEVRAALAGDHAVDLSLADGAARWTFHCVDRPVRLEATVLFAESAGEWSRGVGRASKQIVVDLEAGNALRWMIVPRGAG